MRNVLGIAAGVLSLALAACAETTSMRNDTDGRAAVYASAGKALVQYDLDPASAALTQRAAVTLPENVQYAVPHPSNRFLYVASSNGTDGNSHFVNAFRIDAATGALTPHGDAVALPDRPIHVTADGKGEFLLLAFNKPRTVIVHRLGADGRIGARVQQAAAPDGGFFVHQVRIDRTGRTVLTCALGADASGSAPEQLGQLTVFDFNDGVLTRKASVVPGPGFGMRHLDFHPSLPLVYVAVERGNRLNAYRLEGGTLAPAPSFSKETLRDPRNVLPKQRAGAIRVHPNGRFIYVTNRNDATRPGTPAVYAGGENNVAVFALDERTGEPTLVQTEDTRGFEARTFAIDPSGRIAIAANQKAMAVQEGGAVTQTAPNLAVYRIGADGKLSYVRKYDVTQGGEAFWLGIVALPRS
jgi:6-phosphogluconolactonase